MSVFLTSDWHLGHKLAAEIRGFSSVEEHDTCILDQARKVLSKRTKLFILGDACFSSRVLLQIQSVPGVKALVLGNHDRMNAKSYLGTFNDLHGAVRYRGFLLTHVPVATADSPRYRGNLHGHLHSHIEDAPGERDLTRRHLNLVVERWQFRPIPFEMIDEIFTVRGVPERKKL